MKSDKDLKPLIDISVRNRRRDCSISYLAVYAFSVPNTKDYPRHASCNGDIATSRLFYLQASPELVYLYHFISGFCSNV